MALRHSSSRMFFRDPVGYAASHPGDLVQLDSPNGRAALVRDPEEIWRVLVADAAQFRQGKWKRRARRFLGPTLNTLDGPEHRERRRLVQPALDRRRVAGWTHAAVARTLAAQGGWQDGDRVRLRATLDPLSLTIAGDVLLGVDLEPQAPELAGALAVVMSSVPRLTPPLPGTAQARALGQVHDSIRAILAQREGDAVGRDDLPALLAGGGLAEEVVVGELTAFLLAAVDEPPSGLAAAWYLLSRTPAVEARFHAELDAVLGVRAYTVEDEADLPYLDAVLSEALRLYPPARHVDRCPIADTVVAGMPVAAGTNLLISPLVTHHEPTLFARPTEFSPERWLEREGTPMAARQGYLPFGAGPHTCIGEPLARLIMVAALATIGRRWQLHVDERARPPEPRQPDLEVTLERRWP